MAYGADQVEMPPVENWLTDWDWLDEQWGSERDRHLELGARTVPGRDHGAVRTRLHARDDGSSGSGRERHRELLVDLGQRRPPRRSALAGTPHHLRPARPSRSPTTPASGLQSEERRTARSRSARRTAAASSPISTVTTPPTRPPSTPSTSRSTGSASSPASPRVTPTCSGTGSTGTSSSPRGTTPSACR